MKIELDKYSIKARLYPALLVLLPTFVLGIYYITDFEKYYHYFTAVVALGLFSFLLAQLGRDKGKMKESLLYQFFGGKPTTQILRHSNKYLDSITKERYHRLLEKKIKNLEIPTAKQENKDPGHADQVYESCAKYLITQTRDTKKFSLLFKENINFGFRRNLWGMKSWAIIVILICTLTHGCLAIMHFLRSSDLPLKSCLLLLFLVACLLFWIFIITKKWIKIPAFAYAERLYETLNEI